MSHSYPTDITLSYAQKLSTAKLVKLLNYLSNAYYNTDNSIVSDEIYDSLVDLLKEREPGHKYFLNVGAPVSEKVKLPYPMGSLDKIRPGKESLDNFINKYPGPYFLSDKLDGMSGQLFKNKNGNVYLYSRGDGVYGQDVSKLLPYILPDSVDIEKIPVGMSIRGEIIITKDNFKLISNKMKNARSAAAGIINSKVVDKEIAKLCNFVPYSILNPRYFYDEQMKKLEELGFNIVKNKKTKTLSFDNLKEYLLDRRKNSEYEVDGIVVADNSEIHEHTSGNPDYAFAFKTVLDDQLSDATVVKVHWEASMDGYLKPRIEIEPIELGGVTITFATAFNAKYVVDHSLGPGAKIKIIRSGDVIPYISSVIKKATKPQMPTEPYEWNKTGIDIILKDLYGAQGDVIIIKRLTHFFKTIGVKGLSEGIITKLVNSGYKTIPEILSADKEELEKIDGLGKKIIDKIYVNMFNSLSNIDLATLIGAAHLDRGLGVRKIKELLSNYPDLMKNTVPIDKIKMTNEILKISGFSDVTAKKFVDNFDNFLELFDQINEIVDISHLKKSKKVPKDNIKTKTNLEGQKFVLTGFRDKELETAIEKAGGKVSNSVSNSTTAVIRVDDSFTSGKVDEAKKKGIKIMTRDEFIQIFK